MSKEEFTRILIRQDDKLLRLCSLHLSLSKRQLYLQFKTIKNEPFKTSKQGLARIDYLKGAKLVRIVPKNVDGISRIHYVIDENSVLLTFQKKGVGKQHTRKIKLLSGKIVRFCTLIPNFKDFPIHKKSLGKLDFIFEKNQLFGARTIYVDFWFGKNLEAEEQQNIQSALKYEYMSETGRIAEVLGGYTEQFNIIIGFYQPRNAKELSFTRIMVPTESNE